MRPQRDIHLPTDLVGTLGSDHVRERISHSSHLSHPILQKIHPYHPHSPQGKDYRHFKLRADRELAAFKSGLKYG